MGSIGDIGSGAAAALGGHLLMGLLDAGAEVDLYIDGRPTDIPVAFREHPRLEVVARTSRWKWGRWYSKGPMTAFISSSVVRSLVHGRLGAAVLRNHRARSYDAIFQFSRTELFVLGWARRFLPPIVVHPCTTASGELRWHRRESRYARRYERALSHYMARAFLMFRTVVQRRELRKPALIVGPSEMFNRQLVKDYGLRGARTAVLRHPVDTSIFSDWRRDDVDGRPLTLLFASRLSTRKGLELIIGLSHRLQDLSGKVRIEVVGTKTLWSDYTGHLRDLHPTVGVYSGSQSIKSMPDIYRRSDVLLVPSHYEPGSLVVGEALASGLPVVASSQVGPIEVLDSDCCRVFESGNLDDFEAVVRSTVDDLRAGRAPELAEKGRRQAEQQFAPEKIGKDLVRILRGVSGGQ